MGNAEGGAWVGGRVFTGVRYAEALLVEDGIAVATGSRRSVLRNKSTGTPVRDVGGHLLIPGLIDAHLHLSATMNASRQVDLKDVTSRRELRARIERWRSSHSSEPVVGRGWNEEVLQDHRPPTRRDLDAISTDRPIVLERICGHAAVVNSYVLDAMELDRSSPDPVGGRIGRDSDGSPTGLLYDAALEQVPARWWRAVTGNETALAQTLRSAASYGHTSIGAMDAGPEEVVAVCRRARVGPLKVGVHFFLSARARESFTSLRDRAVVGEAEFAGVKAYADGSFGARTAWLRASYADAPGEVGLAASSEDELRTSIDWAEVRGLIPALHAIGDRAMLEVLRLFRERPRGRLRRIEHASLTPPAVLKVLDQVRPCLVVQPAFVVDDWWLKERLGMPRTRWAYRFRSFLTRGYRLAGSSDSPASSIDPWSGMQAAMDRRDRQGRSANPSPRESLSAEEALSLYTSNAGAALGHPELGSLEPGSPGDLVVLRVHTLEDAMRLGRDSVLDCWRRGRRVHRARSGHRAP